jgi:hypothetical protein
MSVPINNHYIDPICRNWAKFITRRLIPHGFICNEGPIFADNY